MKAIVNGKTVFPEEITEGILLTEGDRILEVLPNDLAQVPEGAEVIDAGGLYVGPGLIDEHLHGYHQYGEGYDIIGDAAKVAACHLKHGVTSVTPSPSYSLRMDRYLSIIDQCNAEIARTEGMPSNIIGIHLEGPYINPRQGAGRKYAWKYSDEAFERLFLAGGKNILHCTYAPEMPHAEKVEAMLQKYGVVMDIGHTEADPESIYRAVKAGTTIVTHLFDATGNYQGVHAFDQTADPQDGVSYVTLSIPNLYYELICDKDHMHVKAASERLALRTAGEDKIILISDCTYHRRADENPEEYAHPELAAVPDPESPDWFTRTGTPDVNVNQNGGLFGSRITVAQCARNFKKTAGVDVRVTFKCASTNPAKAIRIYDRVGSIHPGKYANLVFVDEDFTVKRIIYRGKMLSEVRT